MPDDERVDSSGDLSEDDTNEEGSTTTVDEIVIADSDSTDSEPGSDTSQEEKVMPDGTDKFHAIVESEMSQIAQSGRIAQNNFITTTKFADNDYLEGKRIVSLEEAIGVREVASKSVPAGPNVP